MTLQEGHRNMEDDRRREPSAADIKAEKEAQYKRSLAYSIEKARASRDRTEALKGKNQIQKLNDIANAINNLAAKIRSEEK